MDVVVVVVLNVIEIEVVLRVAERREQAEVVVTRETFATNHHREHHHHGVIKTVGSGWHRREVEREVVSRAREPNVVISLHRCSCCRRRRRLHRVWKLHI